MAMQAPRQTIRCVSKSAQFNVQTTVSIHRSVHSTKAALMDIQGENYMDIQWRPSDTSTARCVGHSATVRIIRMLFRTIKYV